ncbi:MAG: DNA-3-methyladenine glycosylase family protein [Nitrosopumilus sp.]
MHSQAIRVLKKDPKMKKIVEAVGPCTIRTIPDPFEAIIDAIITQQISDSAGKAISKRFRDLFGEEFPKPFQVVKFSNSKLKSAGLSKMKADYILDISKKVIKGELNFDSFVEMTDEEVIEDLIKIRGIGRWTAEMYLIFGLGRMDVFPLGDLGLVNGIKKLYNLDDPPIEKIEKIGKKWTPYRTIGTWYIWRGVKNFQYV